MRKFNKDFNYDYFCKSLLTGVLKAEKTCNIIDAKINRMCFSSTQFNQAVFYKLSSFKHLYDYYDAICQEIKYKDEIILIYQLFTEWYEKLDDKTKKHFRWYFIDKNVDVYNRKCRNFHTRIILPMGHKFIGYLVTHSSLSLESLIANPYVYRNYEHILYARGQEVDAYDRSANAKRDS